MKNTVRVVVILFFLQPVLSFAQSKDSLMVAAIINEANTNSQLKTLAHELMDGIGPRLVGTPKMQQAHDWAVAKYTSWGVPATTPREKIILPANRATGEPGKWPEQRPPTRKGGTD